MIKRYDVNKQPWYKSVTIDAIKNTSGAYYLPLSSMIDYEYYFYTEQKRLETRGYTHRKTASHNGYIPANYLAILPYSGRYGFGVILVSHLTKDKVKFDYYVRRVDNANPETERHDAASTDSTRATR